LFYLLWGSCTGVRATASKYVDYMERGKKVIKRFLRESAWSKSVSGDRFVGRALSKWNEEKRGWRAFHNPKALSLSGFSRKDT
jgi:hypothetical protein